MSESVFSLSAAFSESPVEVRTVSFGRLKQLAGAPGGGRPMQLSGAGNGGKVSVKGSLVRSPRHARCLVTFLSSCGAASASSRAGAGGFVSTGGALLSSVIDLNSSLKLKPFSSSECDASWLASRALLDAEPGVLLAPRRGRCFRIDGLGDATTLILRVGICQSGARRPVRCATA